MNLFPPSFDGISRKILRRILRLRMTERGLFCSLRALLIRAAPLLFASLYLCYSSGLTAVVPRSGLGVASELPVPGWK